MLTPQKKNTSALDAWVGERDVSDVCALKADVPSECAFGNMVSRLHCMCHRGKCMCCSKMSDAPAPCDVLRKI